MATSTRTRAAGVLSLCLLLLSSLGATSALASVGPPAASTHVASAIVIGTGSCIGTDACAGAAGPIGDNSCNGTEACADTAGSIGNKSCNGDGACVSADGSIGNYSCNGDGICEDQVAAVGECDNNAIHMTPDECGQPDARIKRSGGKQLGNDIYNDTGAGQHISLSIYAGDFRRIYITAQNDGLVNEALGIRVDAGSEPGFTIRWFLDRSDVEVTNSVEGGGYLVGVNTGQTFRLRGRIEVSNAVPRGTQIERKVTVESNVNPGDVDVVTFSVKRR